MRTLVATQPKPLPVVIAAKPHNRRVSVSLWLPLTPLLIVLAPLVLLVAPFMTLNRRVRAIGPMRVLRAIGALLVSLSGTQIEVDAPDARVRLRIL